MHEFDSMSGDQREFMTRLTLLVSITIQRFLSLKVMTVLFPSEETTKLEDLQDKNLTQKEMLRDLTAKIEVCDFAY